METIRFFEGKFDELSFDMKDVYALMGYGNHRPSDIVLRIIDEVLDDLRHIINLHYGYTIMPGNVTGNSHVVIQGVDFATGPVIANAMKDADCYALFTCTIGNEFDEYVAAYKNEDDMLRMFIADAVGSVLAESTVVLLIEKLKSNASENGWKTSNNYSPGYCSWNLTDQRKLFGFFPNETTGITLTESCLMQPVKSVSGIIALGSKVVKKPYACAICNQASCIKNKKKQQKNKYHI